MTARIVLVRHGLSAHGYDAGPMDRAGVEKWRAVHDAAGIHEASQPPPALLRMAADATHIVASDLPRAVASAERLGANRQVQISPLFREIALPIPHWPTRLPLSVWETLIHLGWSYRILRGNHAAPVDRARASTASEWLISLVGDGSAAMVVTHGVFRRLLAQELIGMGWTSAGRRGGYRHWSAWRFDGPLKPKTAEQELLSHSAPVR